jgi:hypothetical protein
MLKAPLMAPFTLACGLLYLSGCVAVTNGVQKTKKTCYIVGVVASKDDATKSLTVHPLTGDDSTFSTNEGTRVNWAGRASWADIAIGYPVYVACATNGGTERATRVDIGVTEATLLPIYSGSTQPQSAVATVTVPSAIALHLIDDGYWIHGEKVQYSTWNGCAFGLAMLPGHHTFLVGYRWAAEFSERDLSISATLEAGKTYVINLNRSGMEWKPSVDEYRQSPVARTNDVADPRAAAESAWGRYSAARACFMTNTARRYVVKPKSP